MGWQEPGFLGDNEAVTHPSEGGDQMESHNGGSLSSTCLLLLLPPSPFSAPRQISCSFGDETDAS